MHYKLDLTCLCVCARLCVRANKNEVGVCVLLFFGVQHSSSRCIEPSTIGREMLPLLDSSKHTSLVSSAAAPPAAPTTLIFFPDHSSLTSTRTRRAGEAVN